MFKREVRDISRLVMRNLRAQGLETPLLQKRLVESWPVVAGEAIARYTTGVGINNQTLIVRLSSPALRAECVRRGTVSSRRAGLRPLPPVPGRVRG